MDTPVLMTTQGFDEPTLMNKAKDAVEATKRFEIPDSAQKTTTEKPKSKVRNSIINLDDAQRITLLNNIGFAREYLGARNAAKFKELTGISNSVASRLADPKKVTVEHGTLIGLAKALGVRVEQLLTVDLDESFCEAMRSTQALWEANRDHPLLKKVLSEAGKIKAPSQQ